MLQELAIEAKVATETALVLEFPRLEVANIGFPSGSDGKESAFNEGDLGSIPGLGISPGEGNGSPLQYSCLENPHGPRSLAGYSPRDCRESDTTE